MLGCAVVAQGCVLGPDYKRPPVDAPQAWREVPVAEATSLANTPWWELFADPTLEELIRIALAENKDLKIAAERIVEAQARYGFTKADSYPQIDAGASAGRSRTSEVGPIPLPAGTDPEVSDYFVGVDVSWEIDFFGRFRRANEAERALLLATEEARRSVTITLVADVASAYVDLRAFDYELEISRRTLESRREYLELAKVRYEGGVTSELDFRQAEAEFYRTQALTYDFERQVAETENELAVLLGHNPQSVPRGTTIADQPVPPAVPAGLPSDLLERRPDLRQAEQELVASNARIGEAKALLYPRIALTGSYGTESTDLGDLFDAPARTWSIAAGLLQPIFHGGRNRRRVEITESQNRQALYAYELAILQAFREVEDALVGYRKFGEQRVAQGHRVEAERKRLELSDLRYRGGVAPYLEVLDSQRSLFTAELDEVQSIRDELTSVIRLYKSLGGGWSTATESWQVSP
jgi:outer membrane protein, multidrug efflux system